MYYLAERCAALCEERGVRQLVNIITNGLLLTRRWSNSSRRTG
jgi:hypothetical protein